MKPPLRKDVGQHLWAHTRPGTTKVERIECMLCREMVIDCGPLPWNPAGVKETLILHFRLRHDIEATDIRV